MPPNCIVITQLGIDPTNTTPQELARMANDEFVFAVDTMKPLNGGCIQVFGERAQGSQQHNKQTISLVCLDEEQFLVMLKETVRRLEAGDYR